MLIPVLDWCWTVGFSSHRTPIKCQSSTGTTILILKDIQALALDVKDALLERSANPLLSP